MVERNFLKYNIGDIKLYSHIDAVHAQNPNSDRFTGDIVLGVIQKIDASGIIATISRNLMDINRPRNSGNAAAIDEYRDTIRQILLSKKVLDKKNSLTKNYLHLAIHGMRDERKNEFEIGSRYGNSCSKEVIEWFMDNLLLVSKQVDLDKIFPGDQSKEFHRQGDHTSNYIGYGNKFHTIQIEINGNWRKNKQLELINFLSTIMVSFTKEFTNSNS